MISNLHNHRGIFMYICHSIVFAAAFLVFFSAAAWTRIISADFVLHFYRRGFFWRDHYARNRRKVVVLDLIRFVTFQARFPRAGIQLADHSYQIIECVSRKPQTGRIYFVQ